jgi:23S rRNA (uracil1939-C5)-methyltransferase
MQFLYFIVILMNRIVKLDKKKESATIFVHALSHDGRGIGTLENKKVFIEEGLLHETVTCEIFKKKKNYYEAKAIQIENPSLDRTTPPCKHFGICGGCSLQHMASDAQIELKQKTLLEQLKHFGNVSPLNKVLVGFRERSKPYLADISTCSVLHASVGEQFEALGNLIASLHTMQSIPQIEVAIGDNDLALIFRLLKDLPTEDEEKLIAFAKEKQMQIYIQPNSPNKIYKLWPQDGKERLTYTLPEFDLHYEFYPTDFTQINLEMNRLMIQQAVQLLEINKEETILDLFCGIGNFSLPLAKLAKRVIGIEGSQEMVSRASDNAALNGISNAAFYA